MPDGVTIIGNAATGTGDARGVDLPTEARGDGSDIFERLERLRSEHGVRSPFGPPEQRTVTTPTRAQKAARKADEQRFVAPAIAPETPAPQRVVPAAHAPSPERAAATTGPAGEQGHDPRCGQPLTGAGAPRGWVLVRVVGGGQPRRYCSPACAIAAFEDARDVEKREDRASAGSEPIEYDPELIARVRRLYTLHGLSQAEVVRQIGTSTKVVQDLIARHRIPARRAVTSPGQDRGPGAESARRMAQLRAVGASTADVRVWAAANGLACGDRGVPAKTVVDAYLAAHEQASA